MYLIHAYLRVRDGAGLPAGTARHLTESACPSDGLEHVAVHPDQPTGPVVGLFLIASCLEAAECAAAALCLRAFNRAAFRDEVVFLGCQAVAPRPSDGRLMPRTVADSTPLWKGP